MVAADFAAHAIRACGQSGGLFDLYRHPPHVSHDRNSVLIITTRRVACHRLP